MILARELIYAWLRSLFQQRSRHAMSWWAARAFAKQAGIALAREADPVPHARFLSWNVADRLPRGWEQHTMTEAILASARHHKALLAGD